MTLDIESLYTTIPHQGGLKAIKYFLDQRTLCIPSTLCLTHLTELVLSNNFFLFEKDFYLQKCGTAMGSKMAPNYANLYVGLLEFDFILNPDSNPYLPHIQVWKRYIDDIFVIWTGTATDLTAFFNFLMTVVNILNSPCLLILPPLTSLTS